MKNLKEMTDREFLDYHFERWVVRFLKKYRNYRMQKLWIRKQFTKDISPYMDQYLTNRLFTKMLKAKAEEMGFEFNPHKDGGRDVSSGQEHYVFADDDFEFWRCHKFPRENNPHPRYRPMKRKKKKKS